MYQAKNMGKNSVSQEICQYLIVLFLGIIISNCYKACTAILLDFAAQAFPFFRTDL